MNRDELIAKELEDTPNLKHGVASTYNNHKCRGPLCREAWAQYIRDKGYVRRYQARKRAERKLQNANDSAILEPSEVILGNSWEGE